MYLRNFSLALTFFSFLLIGDSLSAVTFPATGPSGSYSGGSFGTYFRNIMENPCPTGQVISSFQTGTLTYGQPNCVIVSGVEVDPEVGVNTVNYLPKWNGSALVTSQVFDNGANIGIGTATPTASLDINGKTIKISNTAPVYKWAFGGGTDLNWKNIANVTLGTGPWAGASFKVDILDTGGNFGNTSNGSVLTYYVAMIRSGAAQDDNNTGMVSGPINDYVRIVKTATGIYELQVRQMNSWINMQVEVQGISIFNMGVGGSISYVDNPVDGSTTGVIYNPVTTHTDYATNGYFAGNTYFSGSVGIGTQSPGAKLDVAGQVKITGGTPGVGKVLTSDAAGLATWSTEADPKVGINTTNYLSKWNGSALIASTVYENGGNIGINTSTGTYRLEVAGSDMLVNGIRVGKGGANISTNTALGTGVLASNTSGGTNTAIGYQSLQLNTSGMGNTAVGSSTLKNNVGGIQNTANGANSLLSNISGQGNTAVGVQSLQSNTGGMFNTAVGTLAMMNNKSSNNTAFGYFALQSNTWGSNNIALGYSAGSNLTTGSNNIVIGYNVSAPTNTSSNTLNIGNLIFGTAIDGITTTLSTGNIGIGTTSPGAKLEVAGQIKITGGSPGIGKVLVSDATGLATWSGVTASESDPKIGSLSLNYVPKWNGATLEDSRIFDTATGVGIGTSSPSGTLAVNGTIVGNTFYLNTGGPALSGSIDTQYGWTWWGSNISNTNTGNVGIGTLTPGAKLDVIGAVRTNNQFISTLATGTAPLAVTSTTRVVNLNVATAGTADQLTTSRTINGMSFNGTANITLPTVNTTGDQTITGAKDFSTSIGVSSPGGSWLTGMTGINGINALNPQTASAFHTILRQATASGHVVALGGLGDNFGFYGYLSGRTLNGYDNFFGMNVANGNVGIDTSSPTSKLTISAGNLEIKNSTVPSLLFTPTSGSNYVVGSNTAIAGMGIYDSTAGAWRLTIKDTSGNVGIGSFSPGTAKLYLEHSGSNGFVISNTSAPTINKRKYRFDIPTSGIDRLNIQALADDNSWVRDILYIGHDGNVGIGTIPGKTLDVTGDTRTSGEFISTNSNQARFINGNYGLIQRNDGSNFYLLSTASGDQYGSWNGLRPFSINMASGNVYIGNGALTVAHGGSVTAAINMISPNYIVAAANGNGICFWGDCTNYKFSMGNAAENTYGPVTGYSIKSTMNNTAGWGWSWGTPGAVPVAAMSVAGNMQIAGNMTAVAYFYSSDKNLKKNIVPLNNSLRKILSLSGYSFDWKNDGRKDIGVIAQEVEKQFPDIVHTDKNTGLKSVEYGNLVAPLIEAMKEQQEIIDDQNEKIQTLESRLEKIEASLAQSK